LPPELIAVGLQVAASALRIGEAFMVTKAMALLFPLDMAQPTIGVLGLINQSLGA
jgi:hypothetical protein